MDYGTTAPTLFEFWPPRQYSQARNSKRGRCSCPEIQKSCPEIKKNFIKEFRFIVVWGSPHTTTDLNSSINFFNFGATFWISEQSFFEFGDKLFWISGQLHPHFLNFGLRYNTPRTKIQNVGGAVAPKSKKVVPKL